MKFKKDADFDEDLSESEACAEGDTSVQFNFLKETKSEERTTDSELSQYIKWTANLSMEMSTIVYELLSKQMSTDQIQNELVELLGFEQIELTMYLISNRDNVVRAYKAQLIDGQSNKRKPATSTWDQVESNVKQTKLASECTKPFSLFIEGMLHLLYRKIKLKEVFDKLRIGPAIFEGVLIICLLDFLVSIKAFC